MYLKRIFQFSKSNIVISTSLYPDNEQKKLFMFSEGTMYKCILHKWKHDQCGHMVNTFIIKCPLIPSTDNLLLNRTSLQVNIILLNILFLRKWYTGIIFLCFNTALKRMSWDNFIHRDVLLPRGAFFR
jgi:hypothetical protein